MLAKLEADPSPADVFDGRYPGFACRYAGRVGMKAVFGEEVYLQPGVGPFFAKAYNFSQIEHNIMIKSIMRPEVCQGGRPKYGRLKISLLF
jgi:hypothetical protein